MTRTLPKIKNEAQARKIGGFLERDFQTLKAQVRAINERKIPLLRFLGLATDLQTVLRLITLPTHELQDALIERVLADIEAGRTRKETLLSTKGQEKTAENGSPTENENPHEKEKISEGEPQRPENPKETPLNSTYTDNYLSEEYGIKHRKKTGERSEAVKIQMRIKAKFNALYKKDKRLILWEAEENVWRLELVREALSFSDKGIEINVPKFIEIYKDHIQASESDIRKQQQTAADTINSFFGGLPITQDELRRYFILEGGIVKPNPLSISLESYSRLGGRKYKIRRTEL